MLKNLIKSLNLIKLEQFISLICVIIKLIMLFFVIGYIIARLVCVKSGGDENSHDCIVAEKFRLAILYYILVICIAGLAGFGIFFTWAIIFCINTCCKHRSINTSIFYPPEVDPITTDTTTDTTDTTDTTTGSTIENIEV